MTLSIETLLPKPKAASKPLLCIEVNPPRGTDISAALLRFKGLKGIDFFNVTDCALAKLRLSALVFASILKRETGVEPLVNFSCRDRNVIAIQSDLLGGWALGVKSIVALTGDAVTVGDLPDAKGVFEVNSVGLLNIIEKLNSGKDLVDHELKGATQFVKGVVVNPNVKNPGAEIRRLARKKEAGASYALSQPVFDPELAVNFFKEAHAVGVDLFVGVMPFKTYASAEAVSAVPGIRVPEKLLAELKTLSDADVAKRSLQSAMEVAEATRPWTRGVHVISGGAPKLAVELSQSLAGWVDSLV